jgi:hypothetical protein
MPDSLTVRNVSSSRDCEIKLILELFAPDGQVRWDALPASTPRWIAIGRSEFATDKPLLGLAAILAEHLNGVPSAFLDVGDVLDDIRHLLSYWMIESPFTYIFARPASDEPHLHDGIWRILGRLSSLALQSEAMREVSTEGLTPTLVLESHSRQLSREELDRAGFALV